MSGSHSCEVECWRQEVDGDGLWRWRWRWLKMYSFPCLSHRKIDASSVENSCPEIVNKWTRRGHPWSWNVLAVVAAKIGSIRSKVATMRIQNTEYMEKYTVTCVGQLDHQTSFIYTYIYIALSTRHRDNLETGVIIVSDFRSSYKITTI